MRGRRPGRIRCALFRALLLPYPRSIRETYHAELGETFAEMWGEEAVSVPGELRLWWRLFVDGVVNGGAARRAVRRSEQTRNAAERESRMMLSSRLNGFAGDVRHALRGMRRQSGSAFAVVATLALGLGAATAIFSVVDAVLLRPLPFAAPDRLVELQRTVPSGGIMQSFASDHARMLMSDLGAAEAVVPHVRLDMVLTGAGEPRTVRARASAAALFDVLGRLPARGRIFDEREAAAGERVVVLSHEFWSSLGRDERVIGSALELDGARYIVIGVMPADFRFPTRYASEVFLPLAPDFTAAALPHSQVELLARLKDGVTVEAASGSVGAVMRSALGEEADNVRWTAQASALGAHRGNPDEKQALWLVAGAVVLMLLIALLNATNLLLTHVSVRSREFAVRHSLGATSSRVLGQLITESLLLALAAGAAAVGLALVGVRLLLTVAPPQLTDLAAHRVAVDARVLLFTFAVTVVTGFALGLLPALSASRAARNRIGLSLSAYSGSTRERHRTRSVLVVAQVALAMTLLVAAGLLTASFARIMSVDAGFDLDRTALVSIYPNDRAYPDESSRHALALAVEERLRAIAGVTAVSRADALPPRSSFRIMPKLQAEGDEAPRADAPLLLPFIHAPPAFLETLRTPIIAGRNFTPDETPATNVAIMDRDMARFFWGDANPIGRRFRIGEDAPWLTVVGVIDELMLGEPDNSIGEMALLRPAPAAMPETHFAVRTDSRAAAVLPAIAEAIRQVAPNQPVARLWTGRDAVMDAVHKQRFFMLLMSVLGTLSMILASIGLYSLLAFAVTRRTREMGIRMALGARTSSLLNLVVSQGARLAVAGVVLGIGGALAASRVIRGLLFEIEPGAPIPLAAVALIMLVVALAACLLPALRAARLDPATVLRSE